jgi:5-methylcytosine-specific restriction protein A
MPMKLKRQCRYRGCNQLTNDKSGYCDKHKQQVHIDYRKSRTDIKEQRFYGSNAWRQASLEHRRKHPKCQRCGERPSELVHHIKHIKDGGARLASSNFEAVCRSCQAKEHPR